MNSSALFCRRQRKNLLAITQATSTLGQAGALDRSTAIAGDLRCHHDAAIARRKTASLPPLALPADESRPWSRLGDEICELDEYRPDGVERAH